MICGLQEMKINLFGCCVVKIGARVHYLLSVGYAILI